MENKDMLKFMLDRGDYIAIEKGHLTLSAASGNPIPKEWLNAHSDELIGAIAKLAGYPAFLYDSYSTGKYGERRLSGVALQFKPLTSDNTPYVIFNANTTRQRTTKTGKAGEPLPAGKFHAGKQSLFYRFWASSGLNIPPRLCVFHDYMGNLKGIVFTGVCDSKNRLDAKSILPLTITFNQPAADTCHTTPAQLPHNSHTTPTQERHTSKPTQPAETLGLQPIQTTGENNCGNTVIRKGGIRESLSIPTPPQELSTDEWLASYNSTADT